MAKSTSKTTTSPSKNPEPSETSKPVTKKNKNTEPTSIEGRLPKGPMHPDPHVWVKDLGIKSTQEVPVPDRLIDQVLGQDTAVQVALKAAEQKRHLLLIGEPGTGKSMLAKAMTEVLPRDRIDDVLVYHNSQNPNAPKVAKVPGGEAKAIVRKYQAKANRLSLLYRIFEWVVAVAAVVGGAYYCFGAPDGGPLLFAFIVLLVLMFLYFSSTYRPKTAVLVPKLLLEHSKESERAPYVDATGAHAGALLGDIRHDPFQSGGLETPPHVRVEEGAIHRAHKGVLFIDEINVLRLPSQQALLTALQERKYSIVGQSQSSSGAMVKTEPIPCDFILVAAGNLDAVRPASEDMTGGMHPALRSRIRGYGYEVYVNNMMDDNHSNRYKMVQFVAQEVVRDGKIPHFEAPAVAEVIREAQRRAGRSGKLTLRLRELGGLVRTAGDVARSENATIVTMQHVLDAKMSSKSLEQQIADQQIEHHMGDTMTLVAGEAVGVANGLAIVGTGDVGEPAGLVVPVEAAVVPSHSRSGGSIVLGEALQKHHGHGVENVGAVLKTVKGSEIAAHDVHVDALVRHPHAEVDGIGIAAAVAAISALESIAVDQSYVMAGSVAISGDLRPCRATLQRIEAAAKLGFKKCIVPEVSRSTLLVDEYIRDKIEIIHCATLGDVLDHVLIGSNREKREIVERTRGAGRHRNGHKTEAAEVAVVAKARKTA
jgi:ATP-dependent Lon protease